MIEEPSVCASCPIRRELRDHITSLSLQLAALRQDRLLALRQADRVRLLLRESQDTVNRLRTAAA